MPATERILLTCEHGGHRIPRRLAPHFAGAGDVLRSHRGWDPGALVLARRLARRLQAPLLATTVSRLVVDTNRSLRHPRLFSEFTRALSREEREAILRSCYAPHRDAVEERVATWTRAGARVLHLAVHSFDPTLAPGRERCDLGLLYDPRRRREREACRRLRLALHQETGLRVRRNYPYRGRADGLTTALRRRFPAGRYAGVELEVSQQLLARAEAAGSLARVLVEALRGEIGNECS